MAEILDIDHADGTLDAWDTITADGGGSVAASVSAGLGGSRYGMACTATLGTGGDHASADITITAISTDFLRMRCYFDPNGLTMGDSTAQLLAQWQNNPLGSFVTRARLDLNYTTANGYELDWKWKNDANDFHGEILTYISDGPHILEFLVQKASGASADDGVYRLWVDGIMVGEETDVDLYTSFGFDALLLGVVGAAEATTGGTIYFDEIIMNDDGNYIGPVRQHRRARYEQGTFPLFGRRPRMT